MASMPGSWVPKFGTFEVSDGQIRFVGQRIPVLDPNGQPKPGETNATVGLLLSNKWISDGKMSADVVFERATPETICELGCSYDLNADQIVTAGIGGDIDTMFSIREFNLPNRRSVEESQRLPWNYYRSGGSRDAIRAGVKYHLELRLKGSSVVLSIDGVTVAEAIVGSPTGRPRQVLVLCKGDHAVTVSNVSVDSSKPRAFVVMQFSSEYDAVYRDVIKRVLEPYEVIRADEMSGPGVILGDITREINDSQLVVADITPVNANVYFEVGYAMALNKPMVLLARKGTSLPFDVAGFRVLFYEDSIGGKSKLEAALQRHVSAILST